MTKRFAIHCLITTAMILSCGIVQAENQVHLDGCPLVLDMRVSETATLFYVIDELSQWNPNCDTQYITYFEKLDGGLSKEDKDLLTQHAAIRRTYPDYKLKTIFYTPLDLEAALDKAVKEHVITEQEACTERNIFNHFKPRIDCLIADATPAMATLIEKVRSEKPYLTTFASEVSRFTGCTKLTLSVYLIATPDGLGREASTSSQNADGGEEKGILTLEIGRHTENAYDTLVREIFTIFAHSQRNQRMLGAALRSADGLSTYSICRGLAYAYSPGMMGDMGLNRLMSKASSVVENGLDFKKSYASDIVYGLALQPLLKQALSDKNQTLETFLPKAVDTWLALKSLNKAMKPNSQSHDGHDYRRDPRHSIFTFGYIDKETIEAIMKAQHHFFGRGHDAAQYQDMLTNIAKPDDTIVLLVSLDDPGRVPAEFRDLMPTQWSNIESKLKQEEVVVMQGKAREMNTLLIAARTRVKMLEELRCLANDPKTFGPTY